MAGERTPLVPSPTGTAASRRRDRRRLLVVAAHVAVTVSLAVFAGLVIFFAAQRHFAHSSAGNSSTTPAADDAHANGNLTDHAWFCNEPAFEAGYIKLANKKDDHYFYWLANSRSESADTDPLVIWLTGGPGSSSVMALLTENGPCLVHPDGSTHSNVYAWNNHAHVVWLDQPSGVGYSYTANPEEDADSTEENVGANMYAFLDGFLAKHPEFLGRELFITGESYGGHYVPGAAHYLWQQSKLPEGKPLNVSLQGISIGNGLTNPVVQYRYNQDMNENRYNVTLLTDEQVAQMKQDSEQCIALTTECQQKTTNGSICVDAQGCWQEKLIAPFMGAYRNMYDIRIGCTPETPEDCEENSAFLSAFLTSDAVQPHLNFTNHAWRESYAPVYEAFVSSGDWSSASQGYVADMLEDGLRVLVYGGDADLMVNWIGCYAWTLELEWSGKDAYNAAAEHPFMVEDPLATEGEAVAEAVDAGVARQAGNLAFVRVYDAGHMVPRDQPMASWVLLDKFLRGEKL